MSEDIHVHIHTSADSALLVEELKAALLRLEAEMAALDDKLDSIIGKLDRLDETVKTEGKQVSDRVTRFQTTIADVMAQRDALQAQIDAEGITPERQAKLDQIDERLDQLSVDVDQIDPTTSSTIPAQE